VTETDLSGSVQNTYIFFNGQRVARDDSAGAVHYYFSDHLGSHGVVVNATGTTLEQDIDYYPYGGEEHDYSPNVAQNYKFTGKERDAESGLDNFGARYDASSLGRFMTPDWAAKATAVPYAKFGDPQTLNLYAYVENAPLNRIDADGHCGDVRGGDCDGSDSAASGDSNPTGCSRGNGSPCPAAAQSANQQAQGANAVPLTLPTITDPLDLGKIVTVALDAVASAVTSTTVAVAAGVGYLMQVSPRGVICAYAAVHKNTNKLSSETNRGCAVNVFMTALLVSRQSLRSAGCFSSPHNGLLSRFRPRILDANKPLTSPALSPGQKFSNVEDVAQ